jgi:broad specificity phosphatase PhoE
MKLFIFRHGETYFSKNDIPYGDKGKSAEILPEKIPIVEKLANWLKDVPTDINFSSPLKRCKQTVEIISKITGKKFTFDERLRDWEPDEESVQDTITRVVNFAKEIESKNYKSVAICTHGYPINVLTAYFLKGFVRQVDLENFPRPGVLVSVDGKNVSYKDFN